MVGFNSVNYLKYFQIFGFKSVQNIGKWLDNSVKNNSKTLLFATLSGSLSQVNYGSSESNRDQQGRSLAGPGHVRHPWPLIGWNVGGNGCWNVGMLKLKLKLKFKLLILNVEIANLKC